MTNFTSAQRNAMLKTLDQRLEVELEQAQVNLNQAIQPTCYSYEQYLDDHPDIKARFEAAYELYCETGLCFDSWGDMETFRRGKGKHYSKAAHEATRDTEAANAKLEEQHSQFVRDKRKHFAQLKELIIMADSSEQARELLGLPQPPFPNQLPNRLLESAGTEEK